ncbi:hypothetical protein KUTeg_024405 [Tegillarca granosa]|uniref:Uncharacterized protein n=1 Tax=Tegillarca granosa TaxID=220873 RepID=A0ABQ9DX77_TEGGR|nr:hypothetical protein KUTeg_024405 [Tegillarca granosa]
MGSLYSFCSVVCTVSDKDAWCGSRDSLVLIQTNGKIKKKVNTDNSLYDITVTSSGDVIFTESGGHTIKKYSSDKVTIIADNLSPYKTQGLRVTSEQDILVCLNDEKNDNKVVRMSLNGQIKQTIQYNKQNKPLFSNPMFVTDNINADICVVDNYSSVVVVVNKDGQLRFMYPESGTYTHTIGLCFGIACDKLGYILISDHLNSRIHQIDSDGKFVQFVLTRQHGIEDPRGLSIDDKGQLWVCNNFGREVRVYKYRSSCSAVCTVSDKEAWCGSRDNLVLIQINGTIKKKVNLDHLINDITVTLSGDVIFTETVSHTIKMYSSDKVTIVANNLSPYTTEGLCGTSEQDILVCLYNRRNDNKVVRMSLNGQIKQTIQYNKQNKPLFSNPVYVTENINGDICVVDDFSAVVVLNKDGEIRFKYPESGKSTPIYGRCYDLACDKLGYILISDAVNNRIHQVDSEGKFVQFVLTGQHGIVNPFGLSIDDKEQLWVCNNYGNEVTVYKYRS